MTKEISTDAELMSRLLTTQPTPAECLVAAARVEQLAAALAAERAKVAKLVAAGKRVLAPLDEPCRHDHHGYCQAHFIEADCSVAALRAAITEAGQ